MLRLYPNKTIKHYMLFDRVILTRIGNNDLVIQNFDFELIIGYFELSKSQFKAFNLP